MLNLYRKAYVNIIKKARSAEKRKELKEASGSFSPLWDHFPGIPKEIEKTGFCPLIMAANHDRIKIIAASFLIEKKRNVSAPISSNRAERRKNV